MCPIFSLVTVGRVKESAIICIHIHFCHKGEGQWRDPCDRYRKLTFLNCLCIISHMFVSWQISDCLFKTTMADINEVSVEIASVIWELKQRMAQEWKMCFLLFYWLTLASVWRQMTDGWFIKSSAGYFFKSACPFQNSIQWHLLWWSCVTNHLVHQVKCLWQQGHMCGINQ